MLLIILLSINDRRNQVVQRRKNVKEVSTKRKEALAASHTYQVSYLTSVLNFSKIKLITLDLFLKGIRCFGG